MQKANRKLQILSLLTEMAKNLPCVTGPLQLDCLRLTVKAPRKTASENVVCLCRLLTILADFSNLFLHTGKQCGPRSDCS